MEVPEEPATLMGQDPMESVDYCPMGSPVLDTTKQSGVT